MKRIAMVCICTALLVGLPFLSAAASPQPFIKEHRKIAPTPNGDPNGPTEGFLDDPTDWKYLGKYSFWIVLMLIDTAGGYGILNITTLSQLEYYLENPDLMSEPLENLSEGELNIFLLLGFSMTTELVIAIACLLEAYDIMDLGKDGC